MAHHPGRGVHVAVLVPPATALRRPRLPAPGSPDAGSDRPRSAERAISRRGMSMPVVFLSAWGDVPSTARAMREGAIDFLVKPVEEEALLEALERARVRAVALRERLRIARDAEQRLGRLTVREREVSDLVAAGLLNKQIASKLSMSEKTVKVHRGRVTRKLGVDSVAALVRLLFNRSASPPS